MSRFVLTAQLQLQAPNNVRQIVQQIQSQLNGVNVNVQVQNSAQAQRQLQQITQHTNQATTAAERMGRAFSLSVRRFAAFSVATRAVGLFTSTLGNAVQDAIDFERQLVKVAQVTGQTIGQLRGLTRQINSLSTGLGVSSSDLLEVSTVLAQAGLSAEDTAVALRTLAKAALAPNFDSISETAEGAIAILAQFQEGVGALEKQLGSINAVAGAFAVEASDLIDVIRRTGGVFKASGGDLNELLALFTSVRATTRESAESIGTGLRTIFTRIQRPKTIEFLKQFGVELVDLNGKFVGPFEAIKRLSEALSGLGEGDLTFISIAEELGGFRQIGKVLPLLQQFSTAQSALNVAMKAGDSLTQDAASAQAALAIRIMKVKEEFLALIRSLTETSTFQIMANTALSLASALIKIADSIKPLLPMLAALAAFRLVKGMGSFFGGMMSGATSGRTYNKGGKVLGFARGGLVPGSGNRDTVPAMLSPGEFVIRKSSVNKMGAGTLAAMNENRYASGGVAEKIAAARNQTNLSPPRQARDISTISTKIPPFASKQSIGIATASYLPSPVFGNISFNRDEMLNQSIGTRGQSLTNIFGDKAVSYFNKIFPSGKGKGFSYPTTVQGIGKEKEIQFKSIIDRNVGLSITNAANDFASSVLNTTLDRPIKILPNFYDSIDKGFRGNFFENVISALNGKPLKGAETQRPFDFTKGLGKFKNIYSNLGMNYVDARISASSAGVSAGAETQASKEIFTRKAQAQLADELYPQMLLLQRQSEALKKQSNTTNQIVASKKLKLPRKISAIDTNKLTNFVSGQIYKDTDIAQAGIEPSQYRQGFDKIAPGQWRKKYFGGLIQRFATGGGVGTDTVPALLTPGEFVVNRSSAQRIGYGNLNRMNKVGKYAKGGVVQHFATGGGVTSGTVKSNIAGLSGNQQIQQEIAATAQEIKKTGDYAKRVSVSLDKQAKVTDALYQQSSTLDTRISNYDKVLANLAAQQGKAAATGPAANRILKMKIDAESQRIEVDKKAIAEEQKLEGIKKKYAETIDKQTQLMSKQSALIQQAKSNKQAATQLVQQPLTGGTQTNFRGASAWQSLQTQKLAAISARENEFARVRAGKDSFTRGGLGGGMIPKDVGSAAIAVSMLTASLQAMLPPLDENSSALTKLSHSLLGMVTTIAGVIFSLQAFGVNLKAQSAMQFLGGGGLGMRAMAGMRGGMMNMGLSRGFATKITGLVNGLSKLAGPAAAAAAAFFAVKTGGDFFVDSILGYAQKVKEAVDKGDIEDARSAASSQQRKKNRVTTLSGAAAGAVGGAAIGSAIVPLVGTAIGAGVGGLIGAITASKFTELPEYAGAIAAAQAAQVDVQNKLNKATEESTKALEEYNKGTKSGTEVVKTFAAAAEGVANSRKETNKLIKSADRETGFFGQVGAVAREKEIATATKNQQKQETKVFQASMPALNALGRDVALAGGSFDDFLNNLQASNRALYDVVITQDTNELRKNFANISDEVARAKKAFEALNLGLRAPTATATAASSALSNFTSNLEVGSNPVMQSISTLQSAFSEAGQAMDPKVVGAAIDDVASTLKEFGASEKSINQFRGNAAAFAAISKNYNQIFEGVKSDFTDADFRGLNAQGFTDKFASNLDKQLEAAGIDEVTRKRMGDVMQKVGKDLSEDDLKKLRQGDFSVFQKYLAEAGQKTSEQAEKIAAETDKVNQQLIGLTKQRIEAERNLVQAQQEAIDLFMEGREIQGKYGGKAVTTQERRGALLQRSNVEATRLGLSAMRTGDVGELRRRNAEIRGRFSGIESQRTSEGGMQRVGGVEADATQQDLQKAYKTQIDTIRGLIKLEEEQLKITEEKNKLERDSMESLVKGDVEAFFKQQAAVGATAAIASGDQRLMNQYGAEALGTAALDIKRQQDAGVQTLFGQQLAGPGGLTEAAAGAALSSRGVTDMRAAQVMAGTTAEEEASKARLRELGGMLGETGQLGTEMAEMQVQTATVNINTANLKLEEIKERGRKVAAEAERIEGSPAVAKARGGLIYANRGIFVPRGTDTVPAMLTPGEFVVNRGAVQRGNNLQILRAMNGGAGVSNSDGGAAMMARGGMVRYRQEGSSSSEAPSQGMTNFVTALENFNRVLSDNVQALRDTKISIKLDSTSVSINLNDGGLLKALTGQVKQELFGLIENQFKVVDGGRLKRTDGGII